MTSLTEHQGHWDLGTGEAIDAQHVSGFAKGFVTVFCACYVALYVLRATTAFPWLVLGIDLFCLIARKPSLPILYTAFLVGNEAASALIVILWALLVRDVRLRSIGRYRASWSMIALSFLIVALSFLQAARVDTIANVVLSCSYLTLIAITAFACSQFIRYPGLLRCTVYVVVGQFCVSLLIWAETGLQPGDDHFGTLSNAHFFGVFCALAVILLTYDLRERKSFSAALYFALFIALAFMIHEADAKAAVGAGFICVGIFLIFWLIRGTHRTICAFLWAMVGLLIAGSLLLQVPGLHAVLTSKDFLLSGFFNEYVYDMGMQNKFDYFMGTADQLLSDGHIVAGYGLGTYGSRFANMLGYTYTYREPGVFNNLAASFFQSRMIPEYQQFASQYNQQVHDVIQWYSAVLTYPFSSTVTLVGETGLLGVLTMSVFLAHRELRFAPQICAAFFIGICFTDLYFDHIQVIGLLLMFCAGLEYGTTEMDGSAKTDAGVLVSGIRSSNG